MARIVADVSREVEIHMAHKVAYIMTTPIYVLYNSQHYDRG
jgi:hypothetical protein